jgi:1-acyl-sn-glycerol-3-phosphate acyltransferase
MSAIARLAGRASPETAAIALRLAALVFTLAVFVLAAGPMVSVGRRFGWWTAPYAPVAFHRILCAGLGVRVRRRGAPWPAGAQLIVANHVSWMDIPALASVAPMSFLAKKEVGGNLLGRMLVGLQGAIYVDRKRRSCIPAVNAGMAEAMAAGSPVVLFAEATTGDGNRLMRFRSSHFEAIRQAARRGEAVIQPVFIDYSRLAGLPIARGERPRIAWYGDMTFLDHLFGFAREGGVTCDIHFGAPISVSPDLDRKAAARLTEAAVRALARRARALRCVEPILPEGKSAYIALSPVRSP